MSPELHLPRERRMPARCACIQFYENNSEWEKGCTVIMRISKRGHQSRFMEVGSNRTLAIRFWSDRYLMDRRNSLNELASNTVSHCLLLWR